MPHIVMIINTPPSTNIYVECNSFFLYHTTLSIHWFLIIILGFGFIVFYWHIKPLDLLIGMKNFWINGEPITHYEVIKKKQYKCAHKNDCYLKPFQHLLRRFIQFHRKRADRETNGQTKEKKTKTNGTLEFHL